MLDFFNHSESDIFATHERFLIKCISKSKLWQLSSLVQLLRRVIIKKSTSYFQILGHFYHQRALSFQAKIQLLLDGFTYIFFNLRKRMSGNIIVFFSYLYVHLNNYILIILSFKFFIFLYENIQIDVRLVFETPKDLQKIYIVVHWQRPLCRNPAATIGTDLHL